MAYADPQSTSNPTTGQPILAAWGDIVRDDLEYLARNKPHVRAYNSGDLSVANTTAVALTLNSERFDVGGCHSTSSNTSRLTVPSGEAGKYLIGGSGQFAANATGYRSLSIRLNGATYLIRHTIQAVTAASVPTALHVETVYALAAGDYVELIAEQGSGGALNISAVSNYSPEFYMMWEAV